VELKVKMVEAKFHEEKLKLQQQHDVAVQKVRLQLADYILNRTEIFSINVTNLYFLFCLIVCLFTWH
jgi:hypothetical protein